MLLVLVLALAGSGGVAAQETASNSSTLDANASVGEVMQIVRSTNASEVDWSTAISVLDWAGSGGVAMLDRDQRVDLRSWLIESGLSERQVHAVIPLQVQTETETETPTDEPAVNESELDEIVATIDPTLKLHSWSYQDGSFRLVFHSKIPQSVTLTEGVEFSKGVGTFRTRDLTLDRGINVVNFRAREFSGEAVVFISTRACKAQQSCSWVATGTRSKDLLDPLNRTQSFVVGLTIPLFWFLVSALREFGREETKPRRAT